MRKHKLYMIALLAAGFTACERDLETEGITTKITYYPVFEMAGEPEYVLPFGAEFTDPGVTATEQGNPIEVTTSITGTYFNLEPDGLDTSSPDIYNLTYSATNADGYSGSVTRAITILPPTGDLVNSLEGVYTMTVARTPGGGPADADYTDREYGYIVKVGENQYQLSDGIGVYYAFGRAYGPDYAAKGGVIQFEDGVATVVQSPEVGGFGGVAPITAVNVDAGAKTITFKAGPWSGYNFDVTFKQVQP
jgi:hypothetical protein